jgi:hypothetical protein
MQCSTMMLHGRCTCIRALNSATTRGPPRSVRPDPMRRTRIVSKAFEQGDSSPGRDPSISEYVEVKVDSVRVSQGASVVYLRVLDSSQFIPVHIGTRPCGRVVTHPAVYFICTGQQCSSWVLTQLFLACSDPTGLCGTQVNTKATLC